MLRDKDIRTHLLEYLSNIRPANGKICEEQTFHNGKVIADVAMISQGGVHIYEIKGDLDKIERIKRQSEYYNKCASKLSLVTTERHLKKALEILPQHWGIILVLKNEERIFFKYIRKSSTNYTFCKQTALMTLWKSELTEAFLKTTNMNPKSSATREQLADEISKVLTKKGTVKLLGETLSRRAPEFTNHKF